jgi:hypothetical protein
MQESDGRQTDGVGEAPAEFLPNFTDNMIDENVESTAIRRLEYNPPSSVPEV